MLKYFYFFVILLFLVSCAAKVVENGPHPLDDFATCMYDSGVRMYGSYTCSVCKKQREEFGSAFEYIQEIECHPRGENPQTELCFEKGITHTPTWILENDGVEGSRLTGFQPLEDLAELSGCSLG